MNADDVERSKTTDSSDAEQTQLESQQFSVPSDTSQVKEEGQPEQEFLPMQQFQSLENRRLPIDVLLKPDFETKSSLDDSLGDDEEYFGNAIGPQSFLRKACLNSKLCLRTQLMLSFGSVSALMITFVLIGSIIISLHSGENVKSINKDSFEELVDRIEGTTARYLAESLTPKLIQEDLVTIMHESVRDRFSGYPNDGDEFVPFFDVDSQTNKYPVIGVPGKPLPLDWQIEANVNDGNYKEHVQNRWQWYDSESAISTASAVYYMQGMCDPYITDSSAQTYWPNCTSANNDVSTGGVVAPSPTNEQIYRKASALSPILKALYEYHQEIKDLGYYFANSGSGATVTYPHIQQRTNASYLSVGCEWMNAANPYDPSRSIGTQEEIRRCHPEGETVSARAYNPLERGWCREQALHPNKVLFDGPILDEWHEKTSWKLSVGRAVYDRITHEFISCIYASFSLHTIEDILRDSKVSQNSELSVIRSDDPGTVVASTAWNSSLATRVVSVDQLQVGETTESYQALTSLVDYTAIWDPSEVRAKYESFTELRHGFLVARYPMPPIPDSYDPSYRPEFFVVVSTSEEDVFQVVRDVNEDVDKRVAELVLVAIIMGVGGFALVVLIIYLMSNTLTAPLKCMNATADEIVDHFGNSKAHTKKIDSISQDNSNWCAPKTELNEVVKEFNKMVASFSGTFASSARSVKRTREEIPNNFEMQEDFYDLYRSRTDEKFAYDVSSDESGRSDMKDFFNFGSNIIFGEGDATIKQSTVVTGYRTGNRAKSRLFLWTTVLIGTPLLLTTIAISAAVMYTISTSFDSSIQESKSFYVGVELDALMIYAKLRAQLASGRSAKPARDLHLLTRYASWLLFDGLERAESFTNVKTGCEECKTFSEDLEECPFYTENYFCDCAWNEPDEVDTCQNYTFDTRHRQGLYFACESAATFPNGDRDSTGFPNISYSAESTFWWDDIQTLPGSEKGASASGHETTYDRLRSISASPVHQVVYNSDVEKEYSLSTYIAFEADGMFVGFNGCGGPSFAGFFRWHSADWNGAYKLRPELCPKGKYGYDPRCREWYDTGKKLAEYDSTPLYVTPPYAYGVNFIGSSLTSPLIDPETSEHVGQVLVDVLSAPIFDSLDSRNTPLLEGGFPILITTLKDDDTVVGPNFSAYNESARPISELVLSDDYNCTEDRCKLNRNEFRKIVLSMKNGESGRIQFTRTSSEGYDETMYMAYVPVVLNGYRPLNSSDFSRGVESVEYAVYSLALAESEEGLLEPFEQIEKDTSRQIEIAIYMLSAIIVLSILFFLYISKFVAFSVTEPMLCLLELIRSINRLSVDEEPLVVDPSIGSRELVNVFETVQTLYKVVRCGNYAFYSGDLETAYAVLNDAYKLFQSLDNKKAIGVVSNNLGNLLLVIYRMIVKTGQESMCGMTKKDVITKGISFYHDAIQLGEKAYDEFHEREGWSPDCLDFMQHLSNRYFNRGMFLLTVKDGHAQPKSLEKLGMRDLEVARDMDTEIRNQANEVGWKHADRIIKLYDISLVRAKGQIFLMELGYPDKWGTGKLLHDTFMVIKKEMKNNASLLFHSITAAGRLQEFETELISYNILKGNLTLAAQIGIRMLFEDECVFPEAQEKAVEALVAYMETTDVDKETRMKLDRSLATCQNATLGTVDDMSKSWNSMTEYTAEDLTNLTAMRRSVQGSTYTGSEGGSEEMKSSIAECRRGHFTMEEF